MTGRRDAQPAPPAARRRRDRTWSPSRACAGSPTAPSTARRGCPRAAARRTCAPATRCMHALDRVRRRARLAARRRRTQRRAGRVRARRRRAGRRARPSASSCAGWTQRELLLARLELTMEATRDPELAELLADWRARLVGVVDGDHGGRAARTHSDARGRDAGRVVRRRPARARCSSRRRAPRVPERVARAADGAPVDRERDAPSHAARASV